MTPEERKAMLRRRTAKAIQTREQKGLGKRQILNLSLVPASRKITEWAPKTGRDPNYIDIIPWEVTQDWYKNLKSISGLPTGIPVGGIDYKLEIPVHRNIGDEGADIICLRLAFGKKCPICEDLQIEYDKAEREKRDIDNKVRQALAPSWRNYYNIFDLDDQDKGVQQWMNVSFHLFEKFLLEASDLSDGEFETFADLEAGRSIEFMGRQKNIGKNSFTEAGSIKFIERQPYDEDIIQETISFDALLSIPTYEQIQAIYLGISSTDNDNNHNKEPDEAEDEEKQSPPRMSRRQSPKREGGRYSSPSRNTEDTEITKCSKGHIFGKDNNKFPDCQYCDEDEFQRCAALMDDTDKGEENEPKPESEQPSEETKRRPSRQSASARQSPSRTRTRPTRARRE